MKITNRLYVYPVLSEDKDDYIDSEFTVQMTKDIDLNNLNLHFDITMDNGEIEKLISSGEAEYLIHIECSSTAYRTTAHSAVKQIDFSIPIDKINGTVELVAFIVANKIINKFYSRDWNEDFVGLKFDFEKGNVIGYQNLPNLTITKNIEQLAQSESIFVVYKRMGNDGKGMNIDLDKNKIYLGLPEAEYKIYASYNNSPKMQPILNAMTAFPAMIYILEELDQVNDDGEGHNYSIYGWYKTLKRGFANRGLNFEEFIFDETKTSFEKAQEIMQMPIQNALLSIRNFLEEPEDDEI